MDKEIREILTEVLELLGNLLKIPAFRHTTVFRKAEALRRIIKRRLKG